MSFAQQRTITGNVTDGAGNERLPGMSVSIKGEARGTVTDANGAYFITAESNQTMVFSFIGYAAVELGVGNRTTIDVSLKAATNNLEKVVELANEDIHLFDMRRWNTGKLAMNTFVYGASKARAKPAPGPSFGEAGSERNLNDMPDYTAGDALRFKREQRVFIDRNNVSHSAARTRYQQRPAAKSRLVAAAVAWQFGSAGLQRLCFRGQA